MARGSLARRKPAQRSSHRKLMDIHSVDGAIKPALVIEPLLHDTRTVGHAYLDGVTGVLEPHEDKIPILIAMQKP